MARIKIVPPSEATGHLAEHYARPESQGSAGGGVADIIKTMSLRPDFMGAILAASHMHFSDGALSRAQHEMVASYVSALNRCRY